MFDSKGENNRAVEAVEAVSEAIRVRVRVRYVRFSRMEVSLGGGSNVQRDRPYMDV